MSLEIKYLDENDNEIPQRERTAVEGGFTDVEAQVDGSMDTPGLVDGEVPEYEITSGGASETWDPSKPSEGPVLDPISLGKLRLQQLRAAKRIIKRQTRAVQLGQHHVKKVAKGRRKKQLEKASRKRNR